MQGVTLLLEGFDDLVLYYLLVGRMSSKVPVSAELLLEAMAKELGVKMPHLDAEILERKNHVDLQWIHSLAELNMGSDTASVIDDGKLIQAATQHLGWKVSSQDEDPLSMDLMSYHALVMELRKYRGHSLDRDQNTFLYNGLLTALDSQAAAPVAGELPPDLLLFDAMIQGIANNDVFDGPPDDDADEAALSEMVAVSGFNPLLEEDDPSHEPDLSAYWRAVSTTPPL